MKMTILRIWKLNECALSISGIRMTLKGQLASGPVGVMGLCDSELAPEANAATILQLPLYFPR
jgi:hypothetical protein